MIIDWNRYKTDSTYAALVNLQLSKENEAKSKAARNNSEILTKQTLLDKADLRMTLKASADEHVAENYGGKAWGKVGATMVGGAAAAAGGAYVWPFVSPYVTGALNLYGGYHGAKELASENGVAKTARLFRNGDYKRAAISGIGDAVDATLFALPVLKAGRVVEGASNAFAEGFVNGRARATATAINNGIKDTKFTNLPIEHVSNSGITQGAGLRAASNSDVGFHFSPAGSSTTLNILKATGFPFIRLGWWTYTNNTKPLSVFDNGNWSYSYTPELYSGVNPGTTTAENALALSTKYPNYSYLNRFEGQGNLSYMTVEPNFGLSLSKNIEAPSSKEIISYNINNPDVILTALHKDLKDFVDYTFTGNPRGFKISKEGLNKFILPWLKELEQYFNSDFFKNRLKTNNISERIINDINENLNNITYYYNPALLHLAATARLQNYKKGDEIGVIFDNGESYIGYNMLHEGNHAGTLLIPEIIPHNKKLVLDGYKYLKYDYNSVNKDFKNIIDYYLSISSDGITELGGLLANALNYMRKNNLTAELLLLDLDYINRDSNLKVLLMLFKKEYILKLLKPTGIIASANIIYNQNLV